MGESNWISNASIFSVIVFSEKVTEKEAIRVEVLC